MKAHEVLENLKALELDKFENLARDSKDFDNHAKKVRAALRIIKQSMNAEMEVIRKRWDARSKEGAKRQRGELAPFDALKRKIAEIELYLTNSTTMPVPRVGDVLVGNPETGEFFITDHRTASEWERQQFTTRLKARASEYEKSVNKLSKGLEKKRDELARLQPRSLIAPIVSLVFLSGASVALGVHTFNMFEAVPASLAAQDDAMTSFIIGLVLTVMWLVYVIGRVRHRRNRIPLLEAEIVRDEAMLAKQQRFLEVFAEFEDIIAEYNAGDVEQAAARTQFLIEHFQGSEALFWSTFFKKQRSESIALLESIAADEPDDWLYTQRRERLLMMQERSN